MSSDAPALDAHIVVRRGAGLTVDVTLRIAPGTTAALLGPNGAGKSTIVQALAGLVPLDDGHIDLGRRTLDRPTDGVFVPPERRRVGVVFQHYLLFDHLDVVDNISFGPASRHRNRSLARRAVTPWIDVLGLSGLEHRRPRELSGGQAQRVALARALATDPDLLLLDEPLAALDVTTRNRLRRTLADHLGSFGGPRLLITHDPTDAFLLADHVHVIEHGELTQSGHPEEIRRHPATAYVADLAGTNLLSGTNRNGHLSLDQYPVTLQTSDTHTSGPVLITIHPTAVALHGEQPHGSPRNSWSTIITAVEPLGDITRITLAGPLPLRVDVTPAATAALDLEPGRAIWASVKATEVAVSPA